MTHRMWLAFYAPQVLFRGAQSFPDHVAQMWGDDPHTIREQVLLRAHVRNFIPLVLRDRYRGIRRSERLCKTSRVLGRGLLDLGEVPEGGANTLCVDPPARGVLKRVHEPDGVLAEGRGRVREELVFAPAQFEPILQDPTNTLFKKCGSIDLCDTASHS